MCKLFNNKAETLVFLSEQYSDLNIPQLFYFSIKEYIENKKSILGKIEQRMLSWNIDRVAVRSSCSNEDCSEKSGAGAFTSVLNVEYANLSEAIEKVISSYGNVDSNEKVFVQVMLKNITVSGVIMTRNLANGAPYYVINYDDTSCRTDLVTSGQGVSKTVYVSRNATISDFDSYRVRKLVQFSKRLEDICNNDSLDIEFCITADNLSSYESVNDTEPVQDNEGASHRISFQGEKIHLLQVRPICSKKHWKEHIESAVNSQMGLVCNFLESHFRPYAGLFGKTTIFGVMPDWNPAEILGLHPRKLSYSLYKTLITKDIWSRARESMGYRKIPEYDLLKIIAGRPYVDVRLSCNSFLPCGIDDQTAEILVTAWLDRLNSNPSFHDKLEFSVVPTCMDFSFDDIMKERYPNILSLEKYAEYKQALTHLTSNCISIEKKGNSLCNAFDAIKRLNNKYPSDDYRKKIKQQEKLPLIANLIYECRNFGTLPFSILARHGFIAESLLRSAVNRGAIYQERVNELKNSIKTVSSELRNDFNLLSANKITYSDFIKKYGHLRPNTYDILSLTYAERKELFFNENVEIISSNLENEQWQQTPAFVFSSKEKQSITKLLKEYHLPDNTDNLHNYISQAITGREYSKFLFTRHLSLILNLLVSWGQQLELSREELSYLDIQDIIESTSNALTIPLSTYFNKLISEEKKISETARALKLGFLIRSPRDIKVVAQHRSVPNFIGDHKVASKVITLKSRESNIPELSGRIVCIENADPGFDWIFTRNISGLITMFGGPNSHMAIRCAEYNLSAAIGVGEVIFNQIKQSSFCILDPQNQQVQSVQDDSI